MTRTDIYLLRNALKIDFKELSKYITDESLRLTVETTRKRYIRLIVEDDANIENTLTRYLMSIMPEDADIDESDLRENVDVIFDISYNDDICIVELNDAI